MVAGPGDAQQPDVTTLAVITALALAASVHAQRARREAEPRQLTSILDSR